jgi:hypothetical protein
MSFLGYSSSFQNDECPGREREYFIKKIKLRKVQAFSICGSL